MNRNPKLQPEPRDVFRFPEGYTRTVLRVDADYVRYLWTSSDGTMKETLTAPYSRWYRDMLRAEVCSPTDGLESP